MSTERKSKNSEIKEQEVIQSNMIKSITLNNFRQFDFLEVNNLKRVNFLVGKNNCGKTSILEALFWNLSPLRLESIGSIHSFRRMFLTPESLKTLFKNKDETKPISISIETSDNQKQGFKLLHHKDVSNQITIYKDTQQTYNQSNTNKVYTYQVNYKENNRKTVYEGDLVTNKVINPLTNIPELQLQLRLNNIHNKESLKSITLVGAFISDYVGKDLMIHQLNNIKNSLDKRKQVEEYLQYFDCDIQSIEFGVNNSINILTKDDILPLEAMGDGFTKYLRIVVGLINNGLNILFIDEIENGLHHTTQRKLLKIMLQLSEQKNIQLFITTHSLETLTFLSQIMQEEEFLNQKDDVQVVGLTNTELAGFQTFNYNMEAVIDYIKTESELRD